MDRTYSTIQKLRVLVVCEHIAAIGIMLPNVEDRTGLKGVRLGVESSRRGRHGDG